MPSSPKQRSKNFQVQITITDQEDVNIGDLKHYLESYIHTLSPHCKMKSLSDSDSFSEISSSKSESSCVTQGSTCSQRAYNRRARSFLNNEAVESSKEESVDGYPEHEPEGISLGDTNSMQSIDSESAYSASSFILYDISDAESVVEEFFAEVKQVSTGSSCLVRQDSDQTPVTSNKQKVEDHVNVLTGVKKRRIN